MTALFTRNGHEHTGKHFTDEKGKPFIRERVMCWRCGGAGGGQQWAHTGWTCYQCNGAKFTGTRDLPLYTAEKLAKLNATKAKADEKRAAKKAAEAAEKDARIASEREGYFAALPAELLAAYEWATALEGDDGGAASDIATKMARDLYLSEKQIAFLLKLHAQHQEEEVRRTLAVPCPEGRFEIAGTVVSIKWQENDFGGALKMLVLAEAGFKLWGSVPASLMYPTVETPIDKGAVVKFTATVQPSRDDKSFGFFSRPTKAVALNA
jgi:hypothetical protein